MRKHQIQGKEAGIGRVPQLGSGRKLLEERQAQCEELCGVPECRGYCGCWRPGEWESERWEGQPGWKSREEEGEQDPAQLSAVCDHLSIGAVPQAWGLFLCAPRNCACL